MALSNSNSVTKRIDVDRRLTFGEMDENFEQLKLVITDTGNLEIQLGNKVSKTVYDAKIVDIDQSILDLENIVKPSNRYGDTASRPNLTANDIGFMFFDIDLNLPIWWDSNKWITADGTEV